MSEGLDLEAGPLRLAALAQGPPGGTPVLALHGWLDNAASFGALAAHLEGVRLVALDLPGHGHSDHRPPGRDYHFVDYAGDVLAAADALAWERFSLLGHSLGGAIASVIAGACPERIERLALVEAIGPLSDPAANAPRRLADALARTRRPGRPPTPYASLDEAIAARCRAGDLRAETARPLVERGTEDTPAGLRWRTDPRLRRPSPYRLTEEQVLAFLESIRAPTLLVRGEQGMLDPEDAAVARRVAAVRNLELHAVPGGHHVHLDAPGAVAARLAPFLAH